MIEIDHKKQVMNFVDLATKLPKRKSVAIGQAIIVFLVVAQIAALGYAVFKFVCS